jgi:hypothetical protein
MSRRSKSHPQPQSTEELQAQADERRLEAIFEQIVQRHAEEDDEYYLANLEEQCEQQTATEQERSHDQTEAGQVTSDQLPADELPSKEPAPAPDSECMYCHRPSDDALGPVTKDAHGWPLHFACSVQLHTAANEWK